MPLCPRRLGGTSEAIRARRAVAASRCSTARRARIPSRGVTDSARSEAEEVETEVRRMIVADRRRHPARREKERAAPLDAALAGGRSSRIVAYALLVVVGAVPVRRPLADVAEHVEEPVRVRPFLRHWLRPRDRV